MLSDLANITTAAGFLLLIAIILGVGALLIGYFAKAKKPATIFGILFAVFLLAAFVIAATTNAFPSGSTAPVVPGTSVNTLLYTSPALVNGETWNSASSVLTVDILYNVTGSYFCVAATFAATHGCAAGGAGSATHPLDIVFPLNLIRVDANNQTALFNMAITGIPTGTSLGASASTYSVVGFKAATSTSPGQWQTYFSAGTTASQYPSVSAPGTSTNVITDGVAVTAFSHTVNVLHVHLAGTNSTSAPETFAESLSNYTAYPMTLSISQSTPAVVTLDLIEIGWTT